MMKDNENEKRETLADVVAIVRRAAQYYEDEAEKSEGLLRESFKLSAANYREIADRIETAWKQESKAIATENAVLPAVCITKPSGNAAAMREALRYIVNQIDKNPDRLSAGQLLCIIGDKAEAALSTPERNCDKYNTAEDAYDAYDEITHADIDKYDECRQNCPMCDEKLYIPCGVKWLFATAERKGEGDGR